MANRCDASPHLAQVVHATRAATPLAFSAGCVRTRPMATTSAAGGCVGPWRRLPSVVACRLTPASTARRILPPVRILITGPQLRHNVATQFFTILAPARVRTRQEEEGNFLYINIYICIGGRRRPAFKRANSSAARRFVRTYRLYTVYTRLPFSPSLSTVIYERNDNYSVVSERKC